MGERRSGRYLLAFPVALLLAFASGCGIGEDEPESDDEPAAEAPERPGEPEAEAEQAEEPGAVARRILDACREIVSRAPGVPEETRRELIADCEEAASDDAEAARRAAGAACDVIAAVTVPGPLRGLAASACRRAIPGSTRL